MDRRAAAGGLGVDLGELVAGADQADLFMDSGRASGISTERRSLQAIE
ncbi:hypothetical protein [Streptomyces sp. NPDC091217]